MANRKPGLALCLQQGNPDKKNAHAWAYPRASQSSESLEVTRAAGTPILIARLCLIYRNQGMQQSREGECIRLRMAFRSHESNVIRHIPLPGIVPESDLPERRERISSPTNQSGTWCGEYMHVPRSGDMSEYVLSPRALT
jgi:hypothetical protein